MLNTRETAVYKASESCPPGAYSLGGGGSGGVGVGLWW